MNKENKNPIKTSTGFNRRDFIAGAGLFGMANLTGATPALWSGKAVVQNGSVFNVRDS